MFRQFCAVALALALLGAVLGPASAEPQPIAGLRPDARPHGAPALREMVKSSVWYALALTGIEPPYPASLRFLEDQGAWHNPFTRPGMTGPYDIRHWHGGE